MWFPSGGDIRRSMQKIPRFIFWLVPVLFLLAWYALALQFIEIKKDYSTILEDRKGKLLGAGLSADGQWRFPPADSLPLPYIRSLLEFEDKRFYSHPGVDVRALLRAARQNLNAGEVVSGGSTISMQVIRQSLPPSRRTVVRKILEMILATRLELSYSKSEILLMYASDAPFGGNVRGIGAAAWRYFGHEANELSWAESALLAVLPNAPSLLHPAKNRGELLEKRNNLLNRLWAKGTIDSLSWRLALTEPLPSKPQALPMLAPHLLQHIKMAHPGERVRASLDASLQQRAMEVLRPLQKEFAGNGIHNAAVLIAEAETGRVLVYLGNSVPGDSSAHAGQVDAARAPRSYGSLLKPVLFASMQDEGILLPGTLVPDIPTNIAGFSPKNYEEQYDGAVPARRALARSLNIPAVRMLQKYGYEKFYFRLKKLGIKSLSEPAGHYGLSLILGGGEASLFELTSLYASLTRVLLHYQPYNGRYDAGDYRPLSIYADSLYRLSSQLSPSGEADILQASSIWLTYQALLEVNRPDAEAFWTSFSNRQPIAWKTGTSFGNRDAWAIGTTGQYVVGVWVGNADGEGRPLLTGIGCAAPVMFAMFDLLPASSWFEQPVDEMKRIPVCRQSGCRPSPYCPVTDSIWVAEKGLQTAACPYHVLIHLDATGKHRINAACKGQDSMKTVSWFVLPPAMEWFYRHRDAQYRKLPAFREGCAEDNELGSMELLYPVKGSRVYVPTELSGKKSKLVMEAVHREPGMQIFWHLDEQFLGTTANFHQMGIQPGKGHHKLTLVDEKGETLISTFEVLEKE